MAANQHRALMHLPSAPHARSDPDVLQRRHPHHARGGRLPVLVTLAHGTLLAYGTSGGCSLLLLAGVGTQPRPGK